MTTQLLSQCNLCERFRPPLGGGTATCAAFPDGIPRKVLDNEVDHRNSIDGDHGIRWKSHNGADFPVEAFRTKSSRRMRRIKHTPGGHQHNQLDHGGGSRVLDALDSLDVFEGDEYWSRHGDEMYSETVSNGISPRLFENGDMELALDLGDDKFQALGEFDEPDQMRQLADDIDKMLALDLDDFGDDDEDAEGIVDRASDLVHSFSIGRYSNGDVRVESTSGDFEPFDISEEDADKLAEALRSVAEVFDENFETGESGSKSAKTRSHSMSTKSFRPTFKNVGDKGEVTFVVATLNEVDKDGDVTLPGFFGKQHVAMVPVHDWNHVPIGKGLLYEQGNEVLCDVKLNLRIPAAKDWYEAIKFDYENPPALVEYSYGFDVLEGGQKSGYHNGRNVRFLQPKDNGLPGVKVHEVSPVLVGAGTNTRTVSVKGRSMRINRASGATTSTVARAVKGAIPSHETKTASRPWDNAKTVKALPDDSLPSELRTVFAWVDPDGDPEALTSYKCAHHHGLGGPANLRACLIGIAELNQGTSDIPDADRKGVYDHLAAHIRDADRDPPELRVKGSGPAKQYDQLLEGLATLSGLIDGVYSGAARQEKGRGLSKVKSELLGWIGDDLTRLKALLSQPAEPDVVQPSDDELASLAAASLARINGF